MDQDRSAARGVGDKYSRTGVSNTRPASTSDKAWLITDPTLKQQSSERKHPSSPTPKKAKTIKLAGAQGLRKSSLGLELQRIIRRSCVQQFSILNTAFNLTTTEVVNKQHLATVTPASIINYCDAHHDTKSPGRESSTRILKLTPLFSYSDSTVASTKTEMEIIGDDQWMPFDAPQPSDSTSSKHLMTV
ncbi:hypothetical protein TNCV_1033801 [Trichonephila clavipes]|nr:hypothetical protein TNCV_1033801 [Trichonephila clavipes]